MSTKQETFDHMTTHMLAQQTKSLDEHGEPVMVGINGMKDPLGSIIPDSNYSPEMEGRSAAEVFAMAGQAHEDAVSTLVDQVRQIHDFHSPDDWEYWLKQVASSEDLNWNQ